MPSRLRRLLFGPPRDVRDPRAIESMSLVTLLAWVGLGADGHSSSAYGPEEAFRHLEGHAGLAVFLALATCVTVLVISAGYAGIIEQFPSGGGGYLVATKLLGRRSGALSGCALLVDYVLTITVSIASGAEALFSIFPPDFAFLKLPVEVAGLVLLTLLNLRGVKESIAVLVPVFATFIATHALALGFIVVDGIARFPMVSGEVQAEVRASTTSLGLLGTLSVLVRAYSLGGGTYTGIEAVSNGVAIMREPRVKTAQRTMLLMAVSLAVTASGILLAYLLLHVTPDPHKTMNAVLFERFAERFAVGPIHFGHGFVVVALLSEGALLFVAAQTGFVDGPRVMANMAVDSWLPHRLSALSDRLTIKNGVVLLSTASLAALLYTGGDVRRLVVMYAIDVFLTFSLSQLGMTRYFWTERKRGAERAFRPLVVHGVGLALCATILVVTTIEKFREGGWITILATGALLALCVSVERHYATVGRAVHSLDEAHPAPTEGVPTVPNGSRAGPPNAEQAVAILFVGGYGGLGRSALYTLLRMFPGHFSGVVFVTVAIVDSDVFKGRDEVKSLEIRTRETLLAYERFGRSLGLSVDSTYAIGPEIAEPAERLGAELFGRYPKGLVLAGQLVFAQESAWNRVLHNETAFMIQRKLQHRGVPMIVRPVRVDLGEARKVSG